MFGRRIEIDWETDIAPKRHHTCIAHRLSQRDSFEIGTKCCSFAAPNARAKRAFFFAHKIRHQRVSRELIITFAFY